MLDASLAFVLTLAALATIVTVIMELFNRLLRIRKWNLILVMQRLSYDIAKDKKFTHQFCWDFVVKVLNNNILNDKPKLINSKQSEKKSLVPTGVRHFLWDKLLTFSFAKFSHPNMKNDDSWGKAIQSLNRSHATRSMFDKASVEHILRRFVELKEVQQMLEIQQGRQYIKAKLDHLVRKYEEFSASVTADFKRRSQFWSIIIGIFLALAVNINAARIFETYIKNQDLSSRVIGKFEEFEKQAKTAQKKLDTALQEYKDTEEKKLSDTKNNATADKQNPATEKKFSKLIAAKYAELEILTTNNNESLIKKQQQLQSLINANKKPDLKNSKPIIKLRKELNELTKENNKSLIKKQQQLQSLIKQAYANTESAKAQQAMNDAGEKLRSLSELGVPIGNRYFPHCMISDISNNIINNSNIIKKVVGWFLPVKTINTAQNLCLVGEYQQQWGYPFIKWLIITIISGVLIGLGAPFWFDVARRLAEVRSMFGGQKDNEKRLSGIDVEGDPKKREKLVEDVFNNAIADKQLHNATKKNDNIQASADE